MELNTTKNAGKIAIGLIFILSAVVFGSIVYVGFTAVSTDVGIMDSGGDDEFATHGYRDYGNLVAENPTESIRRGIFEYVPYWTPQEPPVIRDAFIGDRGPEPIYGLYTPLDFA